MAEFVLKSFHQKYETTSNELVIRGQKFNLLLPKDLTGFINSQNLYAEFPMWAKIWPASWVMADYLAQMPVVSAKRFLEIGAGVGLVSIVAATFGHVITLTEYKSDALNFARANAIVNGCPQLGIAKLDWKRPQLRETFDYIVASEVTYKKDDWTSLISLFKNYLTPDGEVILTGEMGRSDKRLYQRMEIEFNIRAKKKKLHSGKEELALFLLHMTRKD